MRLTSPFWICLLAAASVHAGSDTPPPLESPYDQNRDALIQQFTAKQEAANWPEKFERIGDEMGVPPDVLAAVAFTETRWEQLTWPPGETVSPQNGMPHPYGVMSLWDNDVLGHSLMDAAALIGATPEALKADPELNIRGAAALLRKYYDSSPLPEGTTADEIESWQNAIVKYCGIQDPYLSYHHVFNCYLAMSQGYDEYGMHWKPHPVNLDPMRAKLKKLLAGQDAHTALPEAQRVTIEPSTPVEQVKRPAPAPPAPVLIAPKPRETMTGLLVKFGSISLILIYLLGRARRKRPGEG